MVRTTVVVNSLSGEVLLGPKTFDKVTAVRESVQRVSKRQGVALVRGRDILEDCSELPGGDLSLAAIIQTLSEEERARCLQLVNAQPRSSHAGSVETFSSRRKWDALLTNLPAPARDDSVVMAAAARRYFGALAFASEVARDDPELLHVALATDPKTQILGYASERLRADRAFVLPIMLHELRLYQGVDVKIGIALAMLWILATNHEVAAMVSALLPNMVLLLPLMGVALLFMNYSFASTHQFLWELVRWLSEDAVLIAVAVWWSYEFPEVMALGQSLLSNIGVPAFYLTLLVCSVCFGRWDRVVSINFTMVTSMALVYMSLAWLAEAMQPHVFRVLLAVVLLLLLLLVGVFYISRQVRYHPLLFTVWMGLFSWQCAGLDLEFEQLPLLFKAMFAWLCSCAFFASSGIAALQLLQLHMATTAS